MTPITVAHGDGIGPEIMNVTLQVIQAAGAQLDIETVEIGEKVYLQGHTTGIEPSTWDSIRRTKVFLKAPVTTPQGGGFKSLNVTIRTTLGLYANVRPCISYHPFVATKHPVMDIVIVRENEEDLYTGIEYQQSTDAVHALKIISRTGCERIIRYAFHYAQSHARKKVTCFTKDNILKLSDGLFHRVFDEIAAEYPDIENEHWIVDIGAAKLANTPEAFDVIVMPNLYGDILSDVAAQIAGSVGLAGSANIGPSAAMFEAIHGSAPRRAGQNLANPSGLMLASFLMLSHIGQPETATRAHNAWLKAIEDGVHTYDIYKEGVSTKKVSTQEFGDAVIERLGQKTSTLKAAHYYQEKAQKIPLETHPTATTTTKELVGVDIFLDSSDETIQIQEKLASCHNGPLKLMMIANRGTQVWPHPKPETTCIDQWRCRFKSNSNGSIEPQQIIDLLQDLNKAGIPFTKMEHLYTFDGKLAYSL